MILEILSKIASFFHNYREDDIELKRTSLNIQRNNLFHQDIPDLATVKQMTGNKFDELQQIFNNFDPIKGESLSKYPSKYSSLTRIVIYKLPKQKTIKDIETLLIVEFSLIYPATARILRVVFDSKREKASNCRIRFEKHNSIPHSLAG